MVNFLIIFVFLVGLISFFFGRSLGRADGYYRGKDVCRKEWETLHIEEDVHWLKEEIKDYIKQDLSGIPDDIKLQDINDSLEEIENYLKSYSKFILW